MNLEESYKILGIDKNSSDEDIVSAYKKLAKLYHPDKNRKNLDIANNKMANLNNAYSTIKSYKFQNKEIDLKNNKKEKTKQSSNVERFEEERANKLNELAKEILINKFTNYKEICKEMLYQYFQYKLYNYANRNAGINKKRYNEIVDVLQSNYHAIGSLTKQTKDNELIEHFSNFQNMLFNFYKQAECSIIYESYNTNIEIQALQLFQKGDKHLHLAQNEIFFNRHNKGTIDKDFTIKNIAESENYFRVGLNHYKNSEFEIETRIKYNYTIVLKNYFLLFFFDD